MCFWAFQLFIMTGVAGKVREQDIKKKKYTSKPKVMKKTQGGREKSTQKQIIHPQRGKQKRAIKWRGGRPCYRCDPREGVPVLYLTLSLYKVRAFYLYSTVMFGISFEGGECEPLLSLAAVRLAQQAPCIEMSAPCRSICSICFIYHSQTIICSFSR